MTITDEVRSAVRRRANCACEYCGLREADIPGRLTLDHYQPSARGGGDSLENLVYACIWCNQRKQAYWPNHESDKYLWNPRQDASTEHFLLLDDGKLSPLTEVGLFTIQRLKLNRPSLITYRNKQRISVEKDNLLTQYRGLVSLQTDIITQLTRQVEKQQRLLAEQQEYLNLLLKRSR